MTITHEAVTRMALYGVTAVFALFVSDLTGVGWLCVGAWVESVLAAA